jgi:hypothetical protein
MRTTLTLALMVYAGTLYAQYPRQYSYPMRLNWSYQAWGLANESEFVRRLPDHNDFDHKVGRLANIRETLRRADYYEEQTQLLREERREMESRRKPQPLYPRLYENPYK